jgi:hypothetical protein
MLECMSLKLHLYFSVYELYYNGFNYVIIRALYCLNRCGRTVDRPFQNAYILCEHNETSNSYCPYVVKSLEENPIESDVIMC